MTELFKAPDQVEQDDPNKDYFVELVGEDKKFKTPQDLARGKAEADRFIEQLQGELAGIRDELKVRVTLEDFMTKMSNPNGNDQPPAHSNNQQNTDTEQKGFSKEDLERLVEERINSRETQRSKDQNVATVQAELKRAFGNDYVNRLKERTQQLQLSEEFMTNLAREQPKAFLSLIGVTENSRPAPSQSNPFTPPSSAVNNGEFKPTGDKTLSSYEALRKSDPTRYWSPEVQNQLHKDAQRLGERFFDI